MPRYMFAAVRSRNVVAMPSLGRVLVVDDEPEVADMRRDVVTSLGYDGEIAGDGPEARRQVAAYQPDIVVLDVGLPGMSGATVLQALRRDPTR